MKYNALKNTVGNGRHQRLSFSTKRSALLKPLMIGTALLLLTATTAVADDGSTGYSCNYGYQAALTERAGSIGAKPPTAITCYQYGSNSQDIDAYMNCFTDNIEMIDVSRTFNGQAAVREWALREVIPHGDTFEHRKILESSERYAKTEVQWLTWVVHYSYWWNQDGKITRMSLQYAN